MTNYRNGFSLIRMRYVIIGALVAACQCIVRGATQAPDTVTQLRHNDPIQAICFNASGSLIATADDNMGVKVWSTSTMFQIRSLRYSGRYLNSIAFSPDSQYLAVAGDHISLYDLYTGHMFMDIPNCSRVAFHPTEPVLATATIQGDILLWDIRKRNVIRRLAGKKSILSALAFSHDGQLIAASVNVGSVWLWNLSGSSAQSIELPDSDDVDHLIFSPTSNILAGANKDEILLWDVTTLTCRKIKATSYSYALHFSSDGRLLASLNYYAVNLWNVGSLKLQSHHAIDTTSFFGSLMFSPDLKVVAGTFALDPSLHILDLQSGKMVSHSNSDVEYDHPSELAVDMHRHYLWVSGINHLSLWNLETGKCSHIADSGHDNSIAANSFSGLLATAGDENAIDVRSVTSKKVHLILKVDDDRNQIRLTTISPDGRLVACAYDPNSKHGRWSVILWDARTGRPIKTFLGNQEHLAAIAVSPSGNCVAVGTYESRVHVCDIRTGQILKPLQYPNLHPGIYALRYSLDGQSLIAKGYRNSLRIWAVRTNKVLCDVPASGFQGSGVRILELLSDGKRYMTVTDSRFIIICDLESGAKLLEIEWPSDIENLACCSNGKYVAIRDKVGIWLRALSSQ